MKNWFTDLDATAERPRPRPERLFAEDFSTPRRAQSAPAEPEIIVPSFTVAELEAARASAFQQGQAAAQIDATAREAEAGARAQEALAEALAQAEQAGRELAELRAHEIAALLSASLAAALPALCARHGEGEIQAVIAAVLPALIAEPEIEVAVAAPAMASARRMIARLDPRLAGRVRLVEDAGLGPGDVRVLWKDGMASRDGGALCAAVLDILAPVGLLPGRTPIRESVHAD